METQKFPFDLDSLDYGDVIAADRLERISGHKAGTDQYRCALLGLQKYLHQHLRLMHKPRTIKIEGNTLRVLTAPEQTAYNIKLCRFGQRRAKRRLKMAIETDVNRLTEEERAMHERAVLVEGRVLQAGAKARRQFNLESTVRQTPVVLLSPPPDPSQPNHVN